MPIASLELALTLLIAAHGPAPAKAPPPAPTPAPQAGSTAPTPAPTPGTSPQAGSPAPAADAADGAPSSDVTRYAFTGLDIDGDLRTPALLQFLARIGGEFEAAGVPHRSFMPELQATTMEDTL